MLVPQANLDGGFTVYKVFKVSHVHSVTSLYRFFVYNGYVMEFYK
jgi:hypothetical protein